MRVAVSGDDFEDAIVQLKNRNVESAATEIVDRDDSVLLFVEAVGERRGRGFVHQAQNFETGDAPCIFRGLTLRIVEIRGHGNDGFRDRRSEKTLGVTLELAKDKSRDFRRRIGFFTNPDAEHFSRLQVFGKTKGEELQFFLNVVNPASHQAFDRVDGALRRLSEVIARRISDDRLVVLVQRDDRWHKIRSIVAGDYDRTLPLHKGHERVRGAQVDADDAIRSHLVIL